VITADLVAEPAGSAVDHHADLAAGEPELRGDGRIEDLRDFLHLEEVVTRAQAAHLVQAALDSPRTDLSRSGTGDHAFVLAPRQVPLGTVALLHRIAGAE
jgi:hypothetical protein